MLKLGVPASTPRRHLTQIVLAVALAACSANQSANHLQPAITAVNTTAPSYADPPLPIDTALVISADGRALLHRILEGKISECMSRAGFVYNGRPFDKRSPYSLASWVGLTKADDARFGYQSLIPASPQIADEALGAPADSDGKAAFFEALLGVNRDGVVPSADGSPVPLREGGCEAAARDAIYDDYDEWVGLNYSVQQLRSQAVLATESDSSYQDANRKWANCMRSAGYDFDAPAEALAAYLGEPGRATATSATEDEVRAATKDVACKTQIDYEDHVMLTLSKYETDIYESNQEVVDEYGRKQDQALSNAAAAAD